MRFLEMGQSERAVILECLKAAVFGPFFPEWEFQTLFGIYRLEMREIVETWDQIDKDSEKVRLAINDAFNNLLRYPHGEDKSWNRYISVPKETVAAIYSKWNGEGQVPARS